MSEYQKLSIREWAAEDRPREKLLTKGLASLSDAELIAILLGSGNSDESAVDLAKRILRDYKNNLNNLGKATVNDLIAPYKGVGEAKAISIVAALEVGRRRNSHETLEREKVGSSRDAFEIIAPRIADLPHEEFWIMMLNRANKVIGHYRVSQGGITGTVIDVRLIMKESVLNNATSIIIAHNHPSGNREPSKQDIDITTKLAEAGKIMEIPVLDHIIVAENHYFSFADEGML